MNTLWDRIEGGIWGLLVGDALGVPFEFCHHASLPDIDILDYELPSGYAKSHAHVPVGTWSDDGAQALCLLTTLVNSPKLDMEDFAERLIRWYDHGYMAVDGFAFDVGNQTCEALNRLKRGVSPYESGLSGSYNNGNGSLMRCLPLSLLHQGTDEELIELAHLQSLVTHAHRRSQVCCALYCLWARYEILQVSDPWDCAVDGVRQHYASDPFFMNEFNEVINYDTDKCRGAGYVVDTLHSVRIACMEKTFEDIIKRAIRFGNDTDTVASLAGGIGGIRHRMRGIPFRWKSRLRGLKILFPIMQRLCLDFESRAENLAPMIHHEAVLLCGR
jgi:ADP-ribosyl-[dinitrogen reductase] hydrolase